MVCSIPSTGLDNGERKELSKDFHSLVVCILERAFENFAVNLILTGVTAGRVGGGVCAALSIPRRHLSRNPRREEPLCGDAGAVF